VDVHRPDGRALDASSSQRQIPARSRRDVQHVHSRLDQLLRQLLPDAVASDPEEDRSLCHPLGAPQVQTVASQDQWMIDGCLEWQRVGLTPPAVVRDATAAYLANEDAFAAWI